MQFFQPIVDCEATPRFSINLNPPKAPAIQAATAKLQQALREELAVIMGE